MVYYFEKRNQKLVAKNPTPLTSGYHLEIDVTAELDAADASYYHSLIGNICWIVELVRIDITCEISMMYSHLELPREGKFGGSASFFCIFEETHELGDIF